MNKTIVAIGGGELKDLDTFKIDEEIVSLTGKKKPKVLFIPTASSDAQGYWDTFRSIFEVKLKCEVDGLFLTKKNLKYDTIKRKIMDSDAIYVGGGNTQKMLAIWQEKGVDKLLKEAWEKGVVMSGLSAGAICWFSFGTSDYESFENPGSKKLRKLKCLGFIDLIVSPHHIREPFRKDALVDIIRLDGGVGIALDDNAALEIINEKYRIISSLEGAKVHKVYRKDGEVYYEELEQDTFYPLEKLLKAESYNQDNL
ncbi:MAG TPA: peptidase E [Candidatus Dojkabacteria bacterium]|jgi:dipeptidase E